ncbi:hypothetical protein [Ruminococcus albus]|uniref:hypothetical protein n=1 Tax=Ruminococcus albus TaxID=1264 RepID=UPI00111452A4|nr:hypothetical protein [Ruminococcus albus]
MATALFSFLTIDLLSAVWYNYPKNYRIGSDVKWQSTSSRIGMTIKLVNKISEDIPISSKAKKIYIDDFGQVFINRGDGG